MKGPTSKEGCLPRQGRTFAFVIVHKFSQDGGWMSLAGQVLMGKIRRSKVKGLRSIQVRKRQDLQYS